MNGNSYFLGVDGGGSKTTAVVFNEKTVSNIIQEGMFMQKIFSISVRRLNLTLQTFYITTNSSPLISTTTFFPTKISFFKILLAKIFSTSLWITLFKGLAP